MRNPNNYWTKERCAVEALKYNTRSEYQNNSGSSYESARKNKWLIEICGHMIVVGDKMRRCIYSAEFEDNFVYVGLTFNYGKRIFDHMRDNRSQISKHAKLNNLSPTFRQLTEYIAIEDAREMEGFYVYKYRNEGWEILNVAETGAVGGGYEIWNKELCSVEAEKYDKKIDFFKKSKPAYLAAYYHGWLDEICSNMKRIIYVRTKNECKVEALKYNTRNEFAKKSSAIYTVATRSGWLDEICQHMPIRIKRP